MITVIVAVIFVVTVAYCLDRWPWLAVGLPMTLVLWTVAPWVFWAGLAVVLLTAFTAACVGWCRVADRAEPGTAVKPARNEVVESGPCPSCRGLMVVTNQGQPRAQCGRCGIRFVAVRDATAPNTGLTWFQIPA